jgi:RNA polymerase sigma-70 factor (ECF subfamily)
MAHARYPNVGADESTFERFYERERDRVYRIVTVAMPSGDAAEATAEAFVRAFVRWRSIRAHPNAVGWVVTTALNYQRSRWRRRAVSATSAGTAPPPEEPLDPVIVRALRALPERQREVVVLRFLCDLSTEQTASLLGIATGTVTAHVHRSVTALREALSDLEEEARRG